MLTCFSAIIPLSRRDVIVDPDRVRTLTREQPLQRLAQFADEFPAVREAYERVAAEYTWFLDAIDRPREEVQEWISEKQNRVHAFERARVFRDAMYELLKAAAGDRQGLRLLLL